MSKFSGTLKLSMRLHGFIDVFCDTAGNTLPILYGLVRIAAI